MGQRSLEHAMGMWEMVFDEKLKGNWSQGTEKLYVTVWFVVPCLLHKGT